MFTLLGLGLLTPENTAVAATPAKKTDVTYSNQIIRLFQERCIDCHRSGQVAPFELTSYEQARGWARMIEEVVEENRMPPWNADPNIGSFRNAMHLTAEEKQLIRDWVAAGAPEGDPAQLPEPKTYPSEWLLPVAPDIVLNVTPEPVDVQAIGTVKYQYFKVDPGFTEDKWIRGSEIRPSNYAVVHHVLVFAREKGKRGLGNAEEGGFLAAYVPGLIPELYPEGMAKRIPANSELIFQMHYTPIGSPQQDLSRIGFVFADAQEITHQVVTSSAVNRRLEIPPGDNNHSVTAFSPRADREGVRLLALMPHMHLRGKSFSYELHTPDGQRTPLLSVPRYDFNWQTAYRLQQELPLPPGSRIKCVAHYDNSEENPHNPDPDKTVRWGDQTWEEMMIGYFDVAVPLEKKSEEATFGTRAQQILDRLDTNGDGVIDKSEVPERWLGFFRLIDRNGDGRITLEELEQAAQTWDR